MNKTLLAATLLAALALTGCTTGETEPTAMESVETAPPLAVDEQSAEPVASDPDAVFLDGLRPRLIDIKDATDEQLIDAGHRACEAFEAGIELMAMQLIDGEVPIGEGVHRDSINIATWASQAYCTEFAAD